MLHSTTYDEGEKLVTKRKPNVVLAGVMGSGKTAVGEMLARILGFGFLDLDQTIEKSLGQSIAQIFQNDGEERFREAERNAVRDLAGIRNHVIAVGGGAVMDEESFEELARLGMIVWLKTPPNEIARRIVMNPDEIRKRPLIADLVAVEIRADRQSKLAERLQVLELQRAKAYGKAGLVVSHAYSTPEICAQGLRAELKKLEAV